MRDTGRPGAYRRGSPGLNPAIASFLIYQDRMQQTTPVLGTLTQETVTPEARDDLLRLFPN